MSKVKVRLVCLPLSAKPVPPCESIVKCCTECGQQVWASTATLSDLKDAGADPVPVCLPCRSKIVGETIMPGPRTMAEIIKRLKGGDS